MKDYRGGILVKCIQAGTSESGKHYSDAVLVQATRLIEGRSCIPSFLGHERPSVQLGRFVDLVYSDGALWGQLVGANVRDLVAMREGAIAAGRPGLGVSIHGRGTVSKANLVEALRVIDSIDVDTRSEAAAAGGQVVFGSDGQPIAWEDRHTYWAAARTSRLTAALESYVTLMESRSASRRITFTESSCGRVLRPIA